MMVGWRWGLSEKRPWTNPPGWGGGRGRAEEGVGGGGEVGEGVERRPQQERDRQVHGARAWGANVRVPEPPPPFSFIARKESSTVFGVVSRGTGLARAETRGSVQANSQRGSVAVFRPCRQADKRCLRGDSGDSALASSVIEGNGVERDPRQQDVNGFLIFYGVCSLSFCVSVCLPACLSVSLCP